MSATAIGPVIGFVAALITIQAAGVVAAFAMSARARPVWGRQARWIMPAVGVFAIAIGLFSTADAVSAAVSNRSVDPGGATSALASILMLAWIVALLGTWAFVGINWWVIRATSKSRPRVITAEETLEPILGPYRARQQQTPPRTPPPDDDES